MTLISLDERAQKVLQAVIHHYICTAKPVGSKAIALNYRFDLSSATIRNIMADLEENGYLSHPHTSAGRVPTDQGYRFYVDKLIQVQELARQETRRIEKEYETQRREFEKIMQQTSRMLSLLSNYTGFILPPLLKVTRFKHIELIFLESKKIFALLITDSELIKDRVIELKNNITPEILRKVSRFYNDKLIGVALEEIKQFIFLELNKTKILDVNLSNLYSDLPQGEATGKVGDFIIEISKIIFDFNDDDNNSIYLEGTANIWTHPDFEDYEKIKSIFELIEQRKFLSRILYKRINDNGVKVLIGKENPCPEMQQCSMITSSYKVGENAVGVLGIIGPKRMEYSKMIALVNFISKLVNEVLNRK